MGNSNCRQSARKHRICASPKFREKLEGWLTVIRTMWPECPAIIDRDGTGLIVDRARAVLTQEAVNAR